MVPPFTDASRARMVMAAEAHELSDFARSFVPIDQYELGDNGRALSDGMWIGDAARLVGAAQRVFEAVVVFERLGGTSWERIGDILGMSKQAAHEKFSQAETRFRDELRAPQNPDYTGEIGQVRYRLHPAARDPEEHARELDEWVARRRDPDEPEHAPNPVSGGLARMDADAELASLSDRRHQLWQAHDGLPPVGERLALAEREVQLWEQFAAERPRSRTTQQWLSHARLVRDELRAQADQQPAAPTGPPALRLVKSDDEPGSA
ncbi:hypothetical protein [Prauserella endophytica]|uniref:Uncharacterized protein n=1 Tax=Prauserella endophytica TaxID=1592324 RepID=A0ABY2RVY1_9PSEU|nr:hypothetical protein [Prauserella endophytica]TKG61526.1 hypothetical protein FCN18_33340 [Prauserella endophytica]